MIATPSDEILMKYASGVLDPALRLLVERHFELFPASRERLAVWEELGGATLAAASTAPLTPGSLAHALARLDAADAPLPTTASHPAVRFPALDGVGWRWAGPGRAIANIAVPDSAMKTYALRIAPGKAMLRHSHVAGEWTLIVQGSYRDEGGEYTAGSFIEEDDETDHKPVATGDMPCICLAVMSGPLSAPGLMGRVAQWMMR